MNLGDELDVLAGRAAAHKSDAVPPGRGRRTAPKGIGTALLERAEEELRADRVRYVRVKPLRPSRPDDEYERTPRVSKARGFGALEDMFGVWPEDNPMLILVKAL